MSLRKSRDYSVVVIYIRVSEAFLNIRSNAREKFGSTTRDLKFNRVIFTAPVHTGPCEKSLGQSPGHIVDCIRGENSVRARKINRFLSNGGDFQGTTTTLRRTAIKFPRALAHSNLRDDSGGGSRDSSNPRRSVTVSPCVLAACFIQQPREKVKSEK